MYLYAIGILKKQQSELAERMQDLRTTNTQKLACVHMYDDITAAIKVLDDEFFKVVPDNTIRFDITADMQLPSKDYAASKTCNALPLISSAGTKVIKDKLSTIPELSNIHIKVRE